MSKDIEPRCPICKFSLRLEELPEEFRTEFGQPQLIHAVIAFILVWLFVSFTYWIMGSIIDASEESLTLLEVFQVQWQWISSLRLW